VIDNFVYELRPEQRFASHEGEHTGSAVVQPVDRSARNLFGHALDAIIIGPTVMAVEVALILGEQIGNDGMEVAG
jgi:hypothetical protein